MNELCSWLAPHFERFVALKRATGVAYDSSLLLLRAFDRFVASRSAGPPLGRRQVLDYLVVLDRLTPRARDNALCVVWGALEYAIAHGARVEPLPPQPRQAPRTWRRREPRTVSRHEIVAILEHVRQAPAKYRSTRPAMATLFGLLYATGIRVGEALALDVGDLEPNRGLLTIRSGKFGKARVIPIDGTVGKALSRYIDHPDRPLGVESCAPIFVSCRRRRFSYPAMREGWKRATQEALPCSPRPRLHDLRHTFAVYRVLHWYRAGRAVEHLLPVLSTYLGHTSLENTRLYLRDNGLLLQEASRRFEERVGAAI